MGIEVNHNELVQVRIDKLKKLQEKGKNPYIQEKFDFTNHSIDIFDKFDELENTDVAVAGRIMLMREHGKATFVTIQDSEGRVQIYVRADKIGDDEYADFITNDIGDIVGIKGTVFKTQKGEISIRAKEVVLLTKSLQPLPDKHAGLKDQDMRYRQRYVDLIVNLFFVITYAFLQCLNTFIKIRLKKIRVLQSQKRKSLLCYRTLSSLSFLDFQLA